MDFERLTHHLRTAYLLSRRFLRIATSAEEAELDAWIRKDPVKHQQIADRTADTRATGREIEDEADSAWKKMRKRVYGKRRISGYRLTRSRVAVTAAAMLLIGIGLYLVFYQIDRPNRNQFDAGGLSRETVLVSPDGKMTVLSAAQQGVRQVGDHLYYLDGQPIDGVTEGPSSVSHDRQPTKMFTLFTPVQCVYQMELADGSKVWINAQSKLSYPEVYGDSIRRVYLEGEAYFEIASGKIPFIVETEDVEIKVHGTNFNVRAYKEDLVVKTALSKGSVSVVDKQNRRETYLRPGQLAAYNRANGAMTVREEAVREQLSWKDGKLYFRHVELGTVIAQLSHWYGFSFEFDNAATRERLLTGVAYTDHELDYTLKLVAKSTGVRFYWKDNKLHIHN